MTFFYLFLVKSFWILSPFLALFIPKIKAFRRQRLNQAWVKMNSPIWFHVASLGEFEQVKPLIKALKTSEQSHEILLTFFSNSAYESAQKYAYVDQIGFLPFETKIDDFIHLIQPKMAVWVRYELWFATWKSLYDRKIPIILLNAFLPKVNLYTKIYAQKCYAMAKKIYCIDEISQSNFLSFGLNAEIASDMRYDQMNEVRNEPFESQVIDDFLSQNTKPILIFGSIWPQEIDLITQNLEKLAGFKSIIVPHKISNDSTEFWKKALPNLNIASHRDKINNQSDFLLYDIMGDLSKLYRYGDIAYIGGGFQGLVHSLIEPMAYGLGLIIMGRGPKNLEVLQLQNAKLLLCLTQAGDFSENIASYLTYIEEYKMNILDTFNQKTGTLPKVLHEIQKSF